MAAAKRTISEAEKENELLRKKQTFEKVLKEMTALADRLHQGGIRFLDYSEKVDSILAYNHLSKEEYFKMLDARVSIMRKRG